MTILFGHPGGNPNSLNAALAHFEAKRLEAFCVPWMPSAWELQVLRVIPGLHSMADRLSRRHFPLLADAPKVQGRLGEWRRLLIRALGRGDERLSYQANDWLMDTMRRECHRPAVTAVHSYEDCSLWQFEEAKRLGKACIYDMPIGYYPAWEQTQQELAKKYADWLPEGGLPSNRYVRPEQKRKEMELADLVLVPGSFVENTIRSFHPYKKIMRAAYSADLDFWFPDLKKQNDAPLRFINVGHLSLRKGIPFLIEAWKKANLKDAELLLVGFWQLSESKHSSLPKGISHHNPCSSLELRSFFHSSDVFVFPSFFEGFGLVLIEAMACGLPAIASEATIGPDVLTNDCGRIVPTGDMDALIESLRWIDQNREQLSIMGSAARLQAELHTWNNYKNCVSEAVTHFV